MRKETAITKSGIRVTVIMPTKADLKRFKEREFDEHWEGVQEGVIRFNDKRMKKVNELLQKVSDNPEKYITSYDEIATSMLKRIHRALQIAIFGKVRKTGFLKFN